MPILCHLRRIAPDNADGPAYAACSDRIDQRPVAGPESAAEIVRQVLVGESGHQVGLLARNVYAGGIAVRVGFDGAPDDVASDCPGLLRIELNGFSPWYMGLG